MELELCKETYSCYEALPPLVETREQSTETIVPDYCPDIARIVEGSGCLFVRSREIADGRVSVSGSLRVTLLYIADGSGGLKSFFVHASRRGDAGRTAARGLHRGERERLRQRAGGARSTRARS